MLNQKSANKRNHNDFFKIIKRRSEATSTIRQSSIVIFPSDAGLGPPFRNRFLIQKQPHGIYSGFSDP